MCSQACDHNINTSEGDLMVRSCTPVENAGEVVECPGCWQPELNIHLERGSLGFIIGLTARQFYFLGSQKRLQWK